MNNQEYKRKCQVAIVDEDKNTKLHYASAFGNIPVLQAQLAMGQNVDAENYLGWTPLMVAVRNGHNEIVDLLLENKADASRKNRYGLNVFLIAVAGGNLTIIGKILSHLLCGGISRQNIQKCVSPISMSILFGNAVVFKYLLEQNFDINAASLNFSLTPLMYAAAMDNDKATKKLLAKKADRTKRNAIGLSADDIIALKKFKITIAPTISVNPPPTSNDNNKNKSGMCLMSPQWPMLVISPTCASPCCPFSSPYPFYQLRSRKSSNLASPCDYTVPNVTPITPLGMINQQQVFFPSNFSPSQYHSPNQSWNAPPCTVFNMSRNDLLNMRVHSNEEQIAEIQAASPLCYNTSMGMFQTS